MNVFFGAAFPQTDCPVCIVFTLAPSPTHALQQQSSSQLSDNMTNCCPPVGCVCVWREAVGGRGLCLPQHVTIHLRELALTNPKCLITLPPPLSVRWRLSGTGQMPRAKGAWEESRLQLQAKPPSCSSSPNYGATQVWRGRDLTLSGGSLTAVTGLPVWTLKVGTNVI